MKMDKSTPIKRKIDIIETQNTPNKKKKVNVSQSAKEYFELSQKRIVNGEEKQFYRCIVCKREINGTHVGNLSSHLSSHKDIFPKICEPNASTEEKRQRLLLDCVEMVTINARSFSHLYDSALHSMLKPILDELESAGRKLNLTDPHLTEVKDCVRDISQKVCEKIRCEIQNRPLSLMIDIVTKRGRSLLGFSLQYIINGKLKVRSIGMVQMKAAHTAIYIADLIVSRLNELGVSLHQILTITTDNGANMLKMVKDMQQILESEMQKSSDSLPKNNVTQNPPIESNKPNKTSSDR